MEKKKLSLNLSQVLFCESDGKELKIHFVGNYSVTFLMEEYEIQYL
jgi:hypothetical protein